VLRWSIPFCVFSNSFIASLYFSVFVNVSRFTFLNVLSSYSSFWFRFLSFSWFSLLHIINYLLLIIIEYFPWALSSSAFLLMLELLICSYYLRSSLNCELWSLVSHITMKQLLLWIQVFLFWQSWVFISLIHHSFIFDCFESVHEF
jgi:hypothetical protein